MEKRLDNIVDFQEQLIPESIIALGNVLGKTIALDARRLKVSQVRICIEIDLNSILSSQIMINHRNYIVNYENIHIFNSMFSSPLLPRRRFHMALGLPENHVNSVFQNSNPMSRPLSNKQEINGLQVNKKKY